MKNEIKNIRERKMKFFAKESLKKFILIPTLIVALSGVLNAAGDFAIMVVDRQIKSVIKVVGEPGKLFIGKENAKNLGLKENSPMFVLINDGRIFGFKTLELLNGFKAKFEYAGIQIKSSAIKEILVEPGFVISSKDFKFLRNVDRGAIIIEYNDSVFEFVEAEFEEKPIEQTKIITSDTAKDKKTLPADSYGNPDNNVLGDKTPSASVVEDKKPVVKVESDKPVVKTELSQDKSVAAYKEPIPQAVSATDFNGKKTFFAFDSSKITAGDKALIKEIADAMKTKNSYQMTIQGHTDSIGTREYNQKLSVRRAAAVKSEFVANGLSPEKITIEGFGEDKPIADNSTQEGRAQNRRAVIFIEAK